MANKSKAMQQHLLEGEFQAQFSRQFLADRASATKESMRTMQGRWVFARWKHLSTVRRGSLSGTYHDLMRGLSPKHTCCFAFYHRDSIEVDLDSHRRCDIHVENVFMVRKRPLGHEEKSDNFSSPGEPRMEGYRPYFD